MLHSEVATVFALCFLVFANGMPQNAQSPLPFLQFTNGGVRVNFGGYHAEAGLGGLLGGSKAGGGLHASAGTPWGAQAGAGLGGLLGGDDATTGGGLYARAGLGNGRPEAAAGLGGRLDGSGRSPFAAVGELFAGATTGLHGAGVSSGTGYYNAPPPPPSPPENNEESEDEDKPTKGHANVQIIMKSDKKSGQLQQAEPQPVQPLRKPDSPVHKHTREVVAASPSGVVAVPEVPQIVSRLQEEEEITKALAVPVVPSAPEANQVTQSDNRPGRVKGPKWVVRKRVWGQRKPVLISSDGETYNPPAANVQGGSTGDVNAGASQTEPIPVQGRYNRNGRLYDDIFNIPVSTLNAVNQLLNNNFGG